MNNNFLTGKYLCLIFSVLFGYNGIAQAQQQTLPTTVIDNKATGRRHLFDSPPTKKAADVRKSRIVGEDKLKPTLIAAVNPQSSVVLTASRPKIEIAESREIVNSVKPDLSAKANIKTTATGGDSVLSVVVPSESDSESALMSGTKSLVEPNLTVTAKLRNAARPATEIYRTGAGDVLDIRLSGAASRESTLYTILEGGLLDYPLAGEPFSIVGMTVEEISELLSEKIKLYDHPEVFVSLRDYSSHKISVSGLVEKPGIKIMRREAVPLFAILAEAVQQPDAHRAEIIRADKQSQIVELVNLKDDVLMRDGDAVRVFGKSTAAGKEQFYFMGGFISVPGEKVYHPGLTLTQAVLAAGGATRERKNRITVSRQNAEGLLVKTEFNLKQIKGGKIPDPSLLPGDRVEIGN